MDTACPCPLTEKQAGLEAYVKTLGPQPHHGQFYQVTRLLLPHEAQS